MRLPASSVLLFLQIWTVAVVIVLPVYASAQTPSTGVDCG
jgi:hypothetical protein